MTHKSNADLLNTAAETLGLTFGQLGTALGFQKDPARSVRKVKANDRPLTPPRRFLLELYILGHRPASLDPSIDSDKWRALRGRKARRRT